MDITAVAKPETCTIGEDARIHHGDEIKSDFRNYEKQGSCPIQQAAFPQKCRPSKEPELECQSK